MPLTALPNVGSQLDRAIAAYLVGQGAGTAADVFTSTNSTTRTLPNTTVKAHASTTRFPTTGNEVFRVAIQFKFKAALQPGETNSEVNRKAIDARVGLAMAAMLQTADGRTLKATADAIKAAGRALAVSDPDNHSDMADFSCFDLFFTGSARGEPDDESVSFVEVRNFEITACPSNVD